MRCYFSDDTCAGRCPWDGNGYLPPQVSSGFLLGVMPDGAAIWASMHRGEETPRPLTRSGVTHLGAQDLFDGVQPPSNSPHAISWAGSGSVWQGWRDDPWARVGVTTLCMSRLVESLSWPVKSRMASRDCAKARATAWEKWEATNPHHRPLPASGRREADSAAG